MTLRAPGDAPTLLGAGEAMKELARELMPIPRSITGNGVRRTLDVLSDIVPIEQIEVPSGTPALDWEVPLEWNLRDAYVADGHGRRLVDARSSPLHVVGYSEPVRSTLTGEELASRLHSLPERPGSIPYRTSYWQRTWGFCVSDEVRQRIVAAPATERYEVVIDASLEAGSLTYGEVLLPGESEREVLISCHVCHPALANDGLSGMLVAAFLARELAAGPPRRLSYRFLFVPGTIGPIVWLARNRPALDRVVAGLVLACVGDSGSPTYKRSRRGDAQIDVAVARVLEEKQIPHALREFSPYGYDERQYCSPGFDLPVGCLMRTPFGEYPEYHTSADDLDLLDAGGLADTLDTCLRVVDVLERDRRYVNLSPYGEPQLGRRGLYASEGGASHSREEQLALLWVLNLSDGSASLLEISARSGLPFAQIANAAERLVAAELLAEAAA